MRIIQQKLNSNNYIKASYEFIWWMLSYVVCVREYFNLIWKVHAFVYILSVFRGDCSAVYLYLLSSLSVHLLRIYQNLFGNSLR